MTRRPLSAQRPDLCLRLVIVEKTPAMHIEASRDGCGQRSSRSATDAPSILALLPTDPDHDIAVSWHSYNFNAQTVTRAGADQAQSPSVI